MDSSNTSVLEMAEYVVESLLEFDFIVQRYDSYSSKSIYLKLDYGVCNSIRISDHKGKKYLKYRYNLLSDRTGVNRHNNGEYPRNFYGFDHVETLLSDIQEDKSEKLMKYGSDRYKQFMQENKTANQGKKGFWEQSYVVNKAGEDMANTALKRLGELPGMIGIKMQVEQIIQLKKISKLRRQHGLKTQSQSNHLIFTGSPGTGKTTAARLIGEAFSALGILKSNARDSDNRPFVEIHHADVTSKFVGDAEKNINKKFEEARGGVLFIDEAYSFIGGEEKHKSSEKVIAAIVQLMEDLRDEVMVIIAGYTKEINDFLDSNPGLRSRFSNTIDFPDYSVPDMIQIAQKMLADQEYQADNGYMSALANRLWMEKDKKGFGNARTVRNIIEESIRMHSVRVSQMDVPSREDLLLLTKSDLQISNQDSLSEKEILQKAMSQIQARLLEFDLRDIISRNTTIE
ncbi:AAA family ATPase [Ralstonia pickettii]|nr:AAA family ATPase [Ralstonia pickettii]